MITTDETRTASKKAIQKTAGATGDLIGNKIADKIIKASSTEKREAKNITINNKIPKERYILIEKKKHKQTNKLLMSLD